MRKFDWGQGIQVVANLGVIASIIFLAVQLQQNNELLNLQVRGNALTRQISAADIVLENPYLLELLHEDPQSLSPTEHDALVLLGNRGLSNLQNAFEDMEQELATEEALRRTIKAVWQRPHLNFGMPLAWPVFKERANPRFVTWMEQNVIPTDS